MRYLVHIVNKSYEVTLGVKDTLVMQEFLDVFLEGFPRLVLMRKMEFNIKLVSRIVPISNTLYKTTPTKLKELKKQLQVLLT